MTIANVIALLGGLGFFLFGMSLLGDGLKRVAGGKLETILSRLTSNTFKGVLLGGFVTAIIQSSSATTVMVVGFVNSGIMKLANAIINKGRYRTYFIPTINCVTLTDHLLEKSGVGHALIMGIKMPGAYLDHLERLYLTEKGVIAGRCVYTRVEEDC